MRQSPMNGTDYAEIVAMRCEHGMTLPEMAVMSRRPLEVLSRSLARDMKRASDDVPDDWSPLFGSVNHVDRILDERPLRARSGHSREVSFLTRSRSRGLRRSEPLIRSTSLRIAGSGVRTSWRAPFLGAKQNTSARQLFAPVRLLHNTGIARPRLNFRSCGLAAIARGAPAVF